MKPRMNQLTMFTVGLAATGMIACGPGNKDGEPVDHVTARQAITANSKDLAKDFTRSVDFLDSSELYRQGVEAGFGYGGTICEPAPIDPATGDPTGEPNCYEDTPPEDLGSLDYDDELDMLIQELEQRILHDDNVESEDGNSVTYLMDGEILCAEDGAPTDPDCVAMVDDAEIRLVVTLPSPGNVDLDIQIGPDRANPLSAQIHQNLLALEVDFGGITDAANHLSSVTGEAIELPQSFEGRLRAELHAESDTRLSAALSVLQAIKVADGEWSISVQPSDPIWSVTADSQAETLEATTNLGAVDGSFPVTDYHYDETTGEESETSYDMGFHLAGSTGTALLDVANEVLTITGAGLGSGTSTASINGEQVVGVDFNDGGTFDATVTSDGQDGVNIELSPKFDLAVALEFAKATDVLSHIEDWMLDEVLRVTLDGVAAPALHFDGEQLEVVDGSLTLELEKAGETVTVDAGQCLLDVYQDDAPSTEDPTAEPVEEEAGSPLDDIAAGACQ